VPQVEDHCSTSPRKPYPESRDLPCFHSSQYVTATIYFSIHIWVYRITTTRNSQPKKGGGSIFLQNVRIHLQGYNLASCAANQELCSVSRNPKVHYIVHKSPPLDLIVRQINLAHTTPSYLSKIHLNIIHLHKSWTSQWCVCFWLSHK
jgi:hypothetical protein